MVALVLVLVKVVSYFPIVVIVIVTHDGQVVLYQKGEVLLVLVLAIVLVIVIVTHDGHVVLYQQGIVLVILLAIVVVTHDGDVVLYQQSGLLAALLQNAHGL